MKEIKFRGLTKYTPQWVYGSLISNVNALTGEHDINGHIAKEDETLFTAIVDEIGCVYEIIPETRGQYINRRDKYGKDIYGGSIVKFESFGNKHIGKIVFNEITCGFEIWYNVVGGAYGEKATYKINFSGVENIEVIGNIHDNKELLEVEE